ncbi:MULTISPECIES: hypothetical protein [Pseudomonas]|uniref:hypothetical protein n=1 Tax=Pseudomonas TaxID=286 RepID=UPI000F973FBA|nr:MULTISPECIES: hypothetical protein [Pseudomonas]MBM7398724.1 hypothetical protein [Pseudomonas sp. M5]UTL81429.1 hypothetical protein NL778_00980 [Pseudomonas putida]HDS1755631.1 hypothetical protein [Pseudomonas putida]
MTLVLPIPSRAGLALVVDGELLNQAGVRLASGRTRKRCKWFLAAKGYAATTTILNATRHPAALHEAHIPSDYLKPDAALPISFWSQSAMMRPDSKVEKVYLYPTDEAIVLTVQELNCLLDGFDLWRNRPHQVLTPCFVA